MRLPIERLLSSSCRPPLTGTGFRDEGTKWTATAAAVQRALVRYLAGQLRPRRSGGSEPKASQLHTVKVTNLIASTWTSGNHGVSFKPTRLSSEGDGQL